MTSNDNNNNDEDRTADEPQAHDEEKEADEDTISERLYREARELLEEEPSLCALLHQTILAPGNVTFEDAVASTVCHRMMVNQNVVHNNSSNDRWNSGGEPSFCPNKMKSILQNALESTDHLELGHTISSAIRQDVLAVCSRDPACETLVEVVLFFKGFAALVCHRAARWLWEERKRTKNGKRSFTALYLQSQASAVFGVDIHPAASIGAGVLFDHGTGIVIGETAVLGDGCTLLHGVTLGGTGKAGGVDRHPKVGENVLIGAGASVLGNIAVGDGAKIGAGSIVLRPIPAGATAVGAPAKIVGRALEKRPGSFMDDTLQNVAFLHKSTSSTSVESGGSDNNSSKGGATATTASTTTAETSSLEDFASSLKIVDMEAMNNPANHNNDAAASTPVAANNDANDTNDANDANRARTSNDDFSFAANSSCMCPFREYKALVKSAPKDSITIKTLYDLLEPAGCSGQEIGQVFFALDTDNVGHIKRPSPKTTGNDEKTNKEDNGGKNKNADTADAACAAFSKKVQKAIASNTTLAQGRVKKLVSQMMLRTTATKQQQQQQQQPVAVASA